jgi:hypothetical protein
VGEGTKDSWSFYLAEDSIKRSELEIREGWIDTMKVQIEKIWLEVTKKDIEIFFKEFIEIVRNAINKNLCLYFTYW